MRSRGVSNFPDPTSRGLVIPNNINKNAPVFTSADQTCERLTGRSTNAGNVIGADGVYLALGSAQERQSPGL